jgi:hypothetical protein
MVYWLHRRDMINRRGTQGAHAGMLQSVQMSANQNRGSPDVVAHGTYSSLPRRDKSKPSQRAGVRKLSRWEKSVHEARCAELYLLLAPAQCGQSERLLVPAGTWTCASGGSH